MSKEYNIVLDGIEARLYLADINNNNVIVKDICYMLSDRWENWKTSIRKTKKKKALIFYQKDRKELKTTATDYKCLKIQKVLWKQNSRKNRS